MSKKLRKEPIYIAPEIVGWLDDSNNPHILDERSEKQLNPMNVDDKIIIYERQVKDWFLKPAENMIRYKNRNKGFIVLMICLSYLEGIEQYRQGVSSENGNSRNFFVSALNRLYPNLFENCQLREFYSEARCGLFHNGMVKSKILISNKFLNSLEFEDSDIKVNPSKFLNDIKIDFDNYIQELRLNSQSRFLFDGMYSNV